MLLAAARGGYRYLRAALRFTAGLSARSDSAGSSPAYAQQEAVHDLRAQAITSDAADGIAHTSPDAPQRARILARVSAAVAFRAGHGDGLQARAVAWLVSIGAFPGLSDTRFGADVQAPPAADLRCRSDPGKLLGDEAIAAPAADLSGCHVGETSVGSCAGAGSPIHTKTAQISAGAVAAATGTAPPTPAAGHLEPTQTVVVRAVNGLPKATHLHAEDAAVSSAAIGAAVPAAVQGGIRNGIRFAASMTALMDVEQLENGVLYVRRAHDAQQDGNVLILR